MEKVEEGDSACRENALGEKENGQFDKGELMLLNLIAEIIVEIVMKDDHDTN